MIHGRSLKARGHDATRRTRHGSQRMPPERFQAIRKEALANIAIRKAMEIAAAASPDDPPPTISGELMRFH